VFKNVLCWPNAVHKTLEQEWRWANVNKSSPPSLHRE
jgi:hypothetical protein